MATDEKILMKGLASIADGGSLDYAPVSGGIIGLDSHGERIQEGADIVTFLALREKGFIDMSDNDTNYHWHPIFSPSFRSPVNIYKITEKGKEYLKR